MYGNDEVIIKKLIKINIFKIIKSFLTSIVKLEIKKTLNYINCFFFIFFCRKIESKLRFSHIELLIICISPLNQGKKYGSFLIQESIKNHQNYFKNYNGIFVKTLKRDTQNISFYEKNNFNIIDEVFGRVYLKFVN
jgi:GNAT superfamily N-acetyltransferase